MGFFKKLINQVKKEYPDVDSIFSSFEENKTTSNDETEDNDGLESIFGTVENDKTNSDCNAEENYSLESLWGVDIECKDTVSDDSDIESDLNSGFSDLLERIEEYGSDKLNHVIDSEKNSESCGPNEINDRKEALNTVYRDPTDLEMAAETRTRLNALMRPNLNARRFLWGTKDLIEHTGDYIIEHSNDGVDELCTYFDSHSIRYDRTKFEDEFAAFTQKSIFIILEREKINEYIFLGRIDGDEIVKNVENIISSLKTKNNEKFGFYLRLNRDLVDRCGKEVESDLFVTIYPDKQYIDWDSPEVKESIFCKFKEKYGFDLYYGQIVRNNFDVTRLN